MKKIFILITISFLSLTGMASAQWFGEVRGIFPFDSDGDNTTPGYTSGSVETAEEDHYGLGLGYRFPSNLSVSLNYEVNDTTMFQNNTIYDDGILYDYVKNDLEIETYMMELGYNHTLNDNFTLIGLLGFGRSEHEIKDEFLKAKINGQNEVTSSRSRFGNDTEISTRIGLGGEYKTNEQISVVGMFTRTDYGTAQSYRTIGGGTSVGQTIEEDQFILGLRYNF